MRSSLIGAATAIFTAHLGGAGRDIGYELGFGFGPNSNGTPYKFQSGTDQFTPEEQRRINNSTAKSIKRINRGLKPKI